MSMTGYAATLAGSTSGSITGLQEITPPSDTCDDVEVVTLGDTNALSAHIPAGTTGGPISVTLVSAKALYATLYALAKAKTLQTWTLTKTGYGAWAGSGFVSELGEFDIATNKEQTYRMVLTPATLFAFTAA